MAITINKVAAKTKPAPAKAKSKSVSGVFETFVEKVDRIAELKKKVEANKAKMADTTKELTALEAELKEHADKLAADKIGTFVGTKVNYVVGEKSKQRTITDLSEVKKAMGKDVFESCIQIALGDIDKYLSKEEADKVTVTTQTGSRSGKIVPKEK